MRLLVTGGAGFIGSNFIRYWLANHQADEILNYDALTYAGCLDSLKNVVKDFGQRYSFVQGDIRNFEQTLTAVQKFKPEVIVNFAAETHNSRAVLEPGIFMETNALGTQRLLEAARQIGVGRFHHISTCEVYGDLALDSSEKFTEQSAYRPRTPYNASKAAADHIVRAYYETFKLPVTISNCANNYGPYQFPEKVIPLFVIKALAGENLPLYEHSHNRREWIQVEDHCRAIEAILKKGQVGETYNVGSEFEADVETIADKVLAHLGLSSTLKKYVSDRPGHDRRYLLDSGKIKKTLSWRPRVDFDQGLAQTIDWYRQNDWWWRPLLKKLAVQEEAWSQTK